MWVYKTVWGSLCTVCCLLLPYNFGHMKRSCELFVDVTLCFLCFRRQCHLLAWFAPRANNWTSVSKIHVPSETKTDFKCFLFSLLKKQTKKIYKSLASVIKGYLFVLVSVNTNGHSHLHMKLMKMYLYIYDNLIGMPKNRPPKPRTYKWYLTALMS